MSATDTTEKQDTQDAPKAEMGMQVAPPPQRALAVVNDSSEFALLLDSGRFEHLQRLAKMFAASSMVPAHYQGSAPNCAIAIEMATRLKIAPMMFMQKTYIIQGKPGIEAQLAIALVNSNGPFTGPIQWKIAGAGKDRSCTAYATHKATGEVCEATVTWAMVEAEGWASKSGSKWKTMPDIMFKYRSATFLARLYCPEVLMGMSSADELEDIRPVEVEVVSTTPGQSRVDALAASLGGKKAPVDPTPEEAAPASEPGDEDPAAAEPEREMLL